MEDQSVVPLRNRFEGKTTTEEEEQMPEQYLAKLDRSAPEQFVVDDLGAQVNDHEILFMKLIERIEQLEQQVAKLEKRPTRAPSSSQTQEK